MALDSNTTRAFPPGQYLLEELEARGWSQLDLAHILGRPIRLVNEIIMGKRAITPETAQGLSAALGTSAELWMNLETTYRLALAAQPDASVSRRARLFEKAPVREMQRRGWITKSEDIDEVEKELAAFLMVPSLSDTPALFVNARKADADGELTTVQHAWCCRAYQMADALPLPARFDESKFEELEAELRALAAYPGEARKVAQVFARFGIAFVVVEPLQGAKIDGAAFWINDKPVIAVSIRYDRLDGFWFTVMHELSHIKHRDALAVDMNIAEIKTTDDQIEQRANQEASSSLVPTEDLQSFIRRVGPLYSKQRIVQFAHTLRIHPGIIVGQLQHLGEVGFFAHREMLVKIRNVVIEAALTDGWGKSTTPGIL